jgi:hypothetical protein
MTTALPRCIANYVVWRDGLVGYGSHGGIKNRAGRLLP